MASNGSEHSFTVINPATGLVMATVPAATEAETDAAIERAARAYETWRAVAPADRARLLRRFAARCGLPGRPRSQRQAEEIEEAEE